MDLKTLRRKGPANLFILARYQDEGCQAMAQYMRLKQQQDTNQSNMRASSIKQKQYTKVSLASRWKQVKSHRVERRCGLVCFATIIAKARRRSLWRTGHKIGPWCAGVNKRVFLSRHRGPRVEHLPGLGPGLAGQVRSSSRERTNEDGEVDGPT